MLSVRKVLNGILNRTNSLGKAKVSIPVRRYTKDLNLQIKTCFRRNIGDLTKMSYYDSFLD